MLQLTVATQPLREATVSQLLNVRELTALDSESELELLPEKQLVSVLSAMRWRYPASVNMSAFQHCRPSRYVV